MTTTAKNDVPNTFPEAIQRCQSAFAKRKVHGDAVGLRITGKLDLNCAKVGFKVILESPLRDAASGSLGSLPERAEVAVDGSLGDGGETIEPEGFGDAKSLPKLFFRELKLDFFLLLDEHFLLHNADIDAIDMIRPVLFEDSKVSIGYVVDEHGPDLGEETIVDAFSFEDR